MSKPHTQSCSVARFLNLFGDAWTWMIVREAFYGATRFTEFQRNTGIAKNLLSERLQKLTGAGFLQLDDVGDKGTRFAYRLTDKGRSLMPIMVAMVQWSNRELHKSGTEPVLLMDRLSGEQLAPVVPRNKEGVALGWGDIIAEPGPGADQVARARIAQSRRPAER